MTLDDRPIAFLRFQLWISRGFLPCFMQTRAAPWCDGPWRYESRFLGTCGSWISVSVPLSCMIIPTHPDRHTCRRSRALDSWCKKTCPPKIVSSCRMKRSARASLNPNAPRRACDLPERLEMKRPGECLITLQPSGEELSNPDTRCQRQKDGKTHVFYTNHNLCHDMLMERDWEQLAARIYSESRSTR